MPKNMAIKFHLRTPGAKNPTAIILTFYFSGKRFVHSTGKKILPAHWDPSRERPKKIMAKELDVLGNVVTRPKYESLEILLNTISNAVDDRHNKCTTLGRPFTLEDFREAIRARSGKIDASIPTLKKYLDSVCAATIPYLQDVETVFGATRQPILKIAK